MAGPHKVSGENLKKWAQNCRWRVSGEADLPQFPAPSRRSQGDGQHRGKLRQRLLQAGHPGCTCRKLPAVLVTELCGACRLRGFVEAHEACNMLT